MGMRSVKFIPRLTANGIGVSWIQDSTQHDEDHDANNEIHPPEFPFSVAQKEGDRSENNPTDQHCWNPEGSIAHKTIFTSFFLDPWGKRNQPSEVYLLLKSSFF